MSRVVLLTVLLISLAHAYVHVFELTLPSVEQDVAREYRPHSKERGKTFTGALGNAWRLPFGCGAILVGLLVDRFGGRQMLAIYLLGCAAMCVATGLAAGELVLFLAMFGMGGFASIYHPAGLALISHITPPTQLPKALGLHGIFGSLGIGGAPLLAAAILAAAPASHWRTVYWVLAGPAIVLGLAFVVSAVRHAHDSARMPGGKAPAKDDFERQARWGAFFTLSVFASLMGFTYAAVLNFLPRYIDGANVQLFSWPSDVTKNVIAGATLFVGCLGQYLAGRFARLEKLEGQLMLITLGNVPGLAAMALASGPWRIAAVVLWSLIHFMHQPIYNSLIAKYTPPRRRSLCYGFSFTMGFGIGSFGALFAGVSADNLFTFGTLAGIVGVATIICGVLWSWNTRRQ